MKLKTLIISLLVSSAALVAVLLLPLYLKKPPPEEEYTRPAELNADIKTASFECSHHGKDWYICYDSWNWGALYCPAYSEFNVTDLEKVEYYFWSYFQWETCFPCPEDNSSCSEVVEQIVAAHDLPDNSTWYLNWYCVDMCEGGMEGELCKENYECTPGQFFCDYASDEIYLNNQTGTCQPCPSNIKECYEDGFTNSKNGRNNCRGCEQFCLEVSTSKLWVDGSITPSMPIYEAIQSSKQKASGVLHDCSVLTLDATSTCPGAEGKMCLVLVMNDSETFICNKISTKAENSGCVGVIASYDDANVTTHGYTELLIPFVFIEEKEGLKLLDENIGTAAKVEVDVFGAECFPYSNYFNNICDQGKTCVYDEFCAFSFTPIDEDVYDSGVCKSCPKDSNGEPDPLACYFDKTSLIYSSNYSYPDTVQNILSCAESCDAEAALMSKSCKFCSEKLTKFEVAESGESACVFCPRNDMLHPERVVALFGDTVTCSDMETFFQRMPVPQESSNCQLAQSMNYICGCDGKGYGGANTHAKKVALAWMPRVSAILSLLVRMGLIYDSIKYKYLWPHCSHAYLHRAHYSSSWILNELQNSAQNLSTK